jgi:hypothetical protein
MKLIKHHESVWETHLIEGYPFGIEKIDARDYVVFRIWGGRRIYLRDEGFTSKAQALAYLEPIVQKYQSSIITAVTA